mmetsp:Transcript_10515/g.32373  ORF Transcript_10515/g.32373 Transcript_10515/m.32373 type:complete len:296 (+) Transcript_10515:1176-2063(+)
MEIHSRTQLGFNSMCASRFPIGVLHTIVFQHHGKRIPGGQRLLDGLGGTNHKRGKVILRQFHLTVGIGQKSRQTIGARVALTSGRTIHLGRCTAAHQVCVFQSADMIRAGRSVALLLAAIAALAVHRGGVQSGSFGLHGALVGDERLRLQLKAPHIRQDGPLRAIMCAGRGRTSRRQAATLRSGAARSCSSGGLVACFAAAGLLHHGGCLSDALQQRIDVGGIRDGVNNLNGWCVHSLIGGFRELFDLSLLSGTTFSQTATFLLDLLLDLFTLPASTHDQVSSERVVNIKQTERK